MSTEEVKKKVVDLQEKKFNLWREIKNKQAFLHDPPMLSEFDPEFIPSWREEKRRCIEGYFAEEEPGKYSYMPGPLYFYTTYWRIKVQDLLTKSEEIVSPHLRDIEFIIFGSYLTCRGFSGFELDEEYTCHLTVFKHNYIQEQSKLGKKTKIKLGILEREFIENDKSIRKPNGDLKEFIAPYEYIQRVFDKPMGRPMYHNITENFSLLCARGGGKSYIASCLVGHSYLFDNIKYYPYEGKAVGSSLLAGPDDAKTFDLWEKVELGLTNLRGAIGDDPHPFNKKWAGSVKAGSALTHKYKEKINGEYQTKGTFAKMYIGNAIDSNPDTATGKRLDLFVVEEFGLCSKIKQCHGAAKRSLATDVSKFGIMFMIGTGGSVNKLGGAKSMWLNPKQYQILSFKDLEKNSGDTGLFIPATYTLGAFKDENGNTDHERALEYIMETRDELSEGDDADALAREKMYMPLSIKEMFMAADNNIFPTDIIEDKLHDLTINPPALSKGWLEWMGDKVLWNEDLSNKALAIDSMNLERFNNKLEGSILVREHPKKTLRNGYFNSLYKIVLDPVKDDYGGTSLYSVLVWKGVPMAEDEHGVRENVVAQWIGRRDTLSNMHDIAVKLAIYYNCKILPESNDQDFIRYCRRQGFSHLLQPTPFTDVDGKKRRKNQVGIYVGKGMTSDLEYKVKGLLNRPIGVDDKGKKITVASDMEFTRILEELSAYTTKKKNYFDSVSCLKVLAYWIDADETKQVKGDLSDEERQEMKASLSKAWGKRLNRPRKFY